jgi:hypothetical protein
MLRKKNHPHKDKVQRLIPIRQILFFSVPCNFCSHYFCTMSPGPLLNFFGNVTSAKTKTQILKPKGNGQNFRGIMTKVTIYDVAGLKMCRKAI